jgi:hypothetical protein
MTLKLGDESEPEVVDLFPGVQLCPFLFSVAIKNQVLNRLVAKQPFITFLVTLQCSLKIQAKLITIAKQPSITFHNDQCNATSRFRHNDFPPYILQHKNIPPKGARHYILDFFISFVLLQFPNIQRGLRGRDHMVVGFTTTCAISVYHH